MTEFKFLVHWDAQRLPVIALYHIGVELNGLKVDIVYTDVYLLELMLLKS
jgi:hypothetical protein